MNTYGPIKSLKDFIAASEDIKSKSDLEKSTISLWWRGQADVTWKILPSLYRGRVNSECEREICRDFRLKSIPFLQGPRPEEHIEWLFLMQHHGAPTRIVDWSESALIGLFFAVEQYDHDADAVVWVLNPWALNTATGRTKSVPTTKSKSMEKYIVDYNAEDIPRIPKALMPIAVRIEYGFNRAHSQRGMATIHGCKKVPIDELMSKPHVESYNKFDIEFAFAKIVIDKDAKMNILKSLYEYSFSWEILFPGLDGLAKSLTFRYGKNYFK